MHDISDVFVAITMALDGGMPSADQLRDIRDDLDDPALKAEAVDYVRGINDPERRVAFLSMLRKLRRIADERCERRKLHKELTIQAGVVGGVGLIGASIVALASATFPAIVVIPVIGGAWTTFQGLIAAQRFDEERHIYEQIAAEMKALLEEIQ